MRVSRFLSLAGVALLVGLGFVPGEARGQGHGYLVNPGDIFLANYNSGTVVKIDGWTGLTTQIGGSFAVPTDLVLDEVGGLYICEWGGAIQYFDLNTGATRTVLAAGSGPLEVWGVTLHGDGNLYVTSRFDDSVHRVDPVTGATVVIATGGSLDGATGIASLDADHVVVANNTGNRVVSVSVVDGSQEVLAEGGVLDRPWGIAVDGTTVFVASYDRKELFRIEGGQAIMVGKVSDFPYGVAFDNSGQVVVGLKGLGEAVVRMDLNGGVSRQFLDPKIQWVTGIDVAAVTVSPPNSGPTASLTVLSRPRGVNVKKARTDFEGSDPDGDPLFVVEVGTPSTLGGDLTLMSRYVGYVPPAGGSANDSFSFTVSDGRGGFASSMGVVVMPADSNAASTTVMSEVLEGGGARVRGDAIPGMTYVLQYGYGPAPAVWYGLTNVTANAIGRFEAFDVGANAGSPRSYRVLVP